MVIMFYSRNCGAEGSGKPGQYLTSTSCVTFKALGTISTGGISSKTHCSALNINFFYNRFQIFMHHAPV